MWPVYSRALRETFVSTITEDEAAVVVAALGRVNDSARGVGRRRGVR
jgi:hypothetical protein